MTEENPKKDETGETKEMNLDKMDKEIEKLTRKVGTTIDESNSQFVKCPNCGLPTFMSPGVSRAYCARCNDHFDINGEGKEKRLKPRDRSISFTKKMMIGAVAVGIMFLFLTGGFIYFLSKSDIDYIDIQDVNDIRELPIAEDVPQSMISTRNLEDRIRDSVDDEERQRLWELERFYKCLFIIPEHWDLVDIVENESSGAGIAGFYDTEEEEMYIVGEMHSTNYVNYILSHEFTHALQDQNFDLDTYMDVGGFDVDLARLCAIEGDAMLTMNKWSDKNMDDRDMVLAQFESIAQVVSSMDYDGSYYNEILGEVSYYPYEGGLSFVEKVYEDHGWDGVNALFTTKPPLSSEHIMHYQKYLDYEAPIEVEFNNAPANYTLRFSSNVGEKLFNEILSFNSGYYSYSGSGYARGWGGDLFNYYQHGEDFLSVIATEWDSEMDNNRFENDITSMADDLGVHDNGLYRIKGKYLHIESEGSSTVIYYGSSEDVVRGYMG